MSEFVLHDGTDENETEALHKFMEQAKTVNGKPFIEWEGCDSGISIWFEQKDDISDNYLEIGVGDKIIIDENGCVKVEKKQ